MKTSKAQRLVLWMGIVGAFAVMVSSVSFFHTVVDVPGLYNADALRARLEGIPLQAIDGAVMTLAMAIPLIISGVGGWMMELRDAPRMARVLLWGGTITWVLTIGTLVASLRIISAGMARAGGAVQWPAELLSTLQWAAWLPIGMTWLLWGGIATWIASGRSPMPSDWWRVSPAPLLALCLGLSWVASFALPDLAPALYAASPWFALALSFIALVAYRWRHPLDA